jgi:hypothetical protein
MLDLGTQKAMSASDPVLRRAREAIGIDSPP